MGEGGTAANASPIVSEGMDADSGNGERLQMGRGCRVVGRGAM